MTITLDNNLSAALLKATGADSLESAVMTALHARLHLLGHELHGAPSAREAWVPPAPEEVAATAAAAIAGIDDALRRVESALPLKP